MCNKKGRHKACVICLVAYHSHCGHACPSAAPSSQCHQQLLKTHQQPLLNLRAMKSPLSQLRTMTHLLPQTLLPMLPVVENVATRMPLLVNADAQRRFVAVCMRTHVGRHLLRKECVKGQEEISLATACGFCGDRVTCSTQVVMRNKRTHALVTLMICDCPNQPAKLRWNTLAKRSASSPCTNHPVRCPLCTKTIWSYCMAQHDADVHDIAQHPDLMHITEAEQEAVLNWVPHKAKKNNQGNASAQAHDAQSDAAASSAPGDVASSSSSLPPLPLPQSKPPAPPLPSESEATTSGAERSRPLKSVGKHNKKRRDEAQRELQSKRARRDSSSSSSEGELFKDL